MSQLPYQPMREPRKEVTQEGMWTTLAKHAKSEVESLRKKAGESPKEKLREPLVWEEPVKTGKNSGYVLTRCGRFSIVKDLTHQKPMYMAWLRKDPPHTGVLLGIRETRAEAEHLCELAA